LFSGRESLIEELVRHGLGALILAGFFAVIYIATRRFLGELGKTRSRGATKFAAASIALSLILLITRESLEKYVAGAAAPLNRLTTSTPSNWPEQTAVGLFRTLIVLVFLVLLIQAVGRLYWYAQARLMQWHPAPKGLGVHVAVFLTMLLGLFRYMSVLILVLSFLPVVLNFFPRTRVLVDRTGSFLATPAKEVGHAVLEYLPNLGYLIVILTLGWYSLRAMKYLFTSLDNGSLVIGGFMQEWALPTYRLVRTLFVLFLVMVTYPYLPGSKSQFFQGFSVFLGALITFGSTATIGNIVSGTMLTYTRAFRIGDMVTIVEKTGIVLEKSLLVTRLLTPENEEVSIPNGNVLSSSIHNYSARSREGLVLRVTAGIGYDVDWRKVHQLMIEGAHATQHVLAEPVPQVWQAALGDYAVNYELRALTNSPELMFRTLSTLRANVLDAFNRGGVEIMTPSILAHRDASNLAIPPEQFRERPPRAGIAIDVRNDGSIASAV
jgi:small-conductance mechanosensitive channel